jgi:hypothetical protein
LIRPLNDCLMSPTRSQDGHPGIDVALDKLVQSDITHMNHAKIDMAVVSLFHDCDIPFNAVASASFKIMLNYARLVGRDYKPPSRQALGTPLLDKLENWGVGINELKAKTVKRVLRAWVEEWEKEFIKHKMQLLRYGYRRSIRA